MYNLIYVKKYEEMLGLVPAATNGISHDIARNVFHKLTPLNEVGYTHLLTFKITAFIIYIYLCYMCMHYIVIYKNDIYIYNIYMV